MNAHLVGLVLAVAIAGLASGTTHAQPMPHGSRPGIMSPGPGADPQLAVVAQAPMPGVPMEHSPTPFYREWTFHVLLGLGAAAVAFVAYRARLRHGWRRPPAGLISEAVLVVDLVDSTHLATHHGGSFAMRARNALAERTQAAAKGRGMAFVETTGDGCLMTFPTVAAAAETARALLRDLRNRPPDLSLGLPMEVRAGMTYGEIFLDARGVRHGAPINRAFRLIGLQPEHFARVEGEEGLREIPDRNRIFVDEEVANELGDPERAYRFVGFGRLKGFTGLHRIYELDWSGSSKGATS